MTTLETFIDDQSIDDPSLDAFDRWAFACKCARAIAGYGSQENLVVGLYGKWGEGKTTTLKYLRRALEAETKDCIVVWFNPWRYDDENSLIAAFFQSLATELGKRLTGHNADAVRHIKNLGKLLQLAKFAPLAGEVGNFLEWIGGIGETPDLESEKQKLNAILAGAVKRIVVFFDDVDRLDLSEIRALFRLVKLNADFVNTVYVMAFDDSVVSKALDKEYGASFLEKIVQVPVRLPGISEAQLQVYCFSLIDRLASRMNLEFSQTERQRFSRQFAFNLTTRIRVPRDARRYVNALAFAIPALLGEVNTVDLMLIEGIRLFYPTLYGVIRDHGQQLINADILSLDSQRDQLRGELRTILNDTLNVLAPAETKAAWELLRELFPRSAGLEPGSLAMSYTRQHDAVWSRDKRACSSEYFGRYFTYSVGPDDISDEVVAQMILRCTTQRPEEISQFILSAVHGDSQSRLLISKLERAIEGIPVQAAKNLTLALSLSGSVFPRPHTLFPFESPFGQAAMLVAEIIRRLPNAEDRIELARSVITSGEPLSFVTEGYNWLHSPDDETTNRVFSSDEQAELDRLLVSRIEQVALQKALFVSFTRDTSLFLGLWARNKSKSETSAYIGSVLSDTPSLVLDLLKGYIARSYGETGWRDIALVPAGFDSLCRVVDPRVVFDALHKAFDLDIADGINPESENESIEEDDDLRFARHFIWYYGNRIDRKSKPEGNADDAQSEE